MKYELVGENRHLKPPAEFAGVDSDTALQLVHEYCQQSAKVFCELYLKGYTKEQISLQVRAKLEYVEDIIRGAETILRDVLDEQAAHEARIRAEQEERVRELSQQTGKVAARASVVYDEPRRHHWSDDALCRDDEVDPELFFSFKAEQVEEAKAYCESCPVTADCLMYALQKSESDGIWGGMSADERRALKNKNARGRTA